MRGSKQTQIVQKAKKLVQRNPKYQFLGENDLRNRRIPLQRTFSIKMVESVAKLERTRLKANRVLKKPLYPDPDDCCDSGCVPCVYDTYERDLEAWEQYQKKVEIEKKLFKGFDEESES